MSKLGIKAELVNKVDTVIEIARCLLNAGYDAKLIQIRIEYGTMPKEY